MNRRETIAAVAAAVLAGAMEAEPQSADQMHPAKYKALADSSGKCVSTGEDCLRHCLEMMAMKDTTMAACAGAVVQMIAACRAMQTLASFNSKFTASFAKDTAAVCDDCEIECRKFASKYSICRACADACKACGAECRKATA